MNASHFSPDTLEFLRLLALNKVQYVIVGGEAVIYYGYARLTGDVDFFDLINRIDGVTFDEAWKSRIEDEIEWENQRISVFYIGLSELIKNKESIRRGKDLEDLKYLKSSIKSRPPRG